MLCYDEDGILKTARFASLARNGNEGFGKNGRRQSTEKIITIYKKRKNFSFFSCQELKNHL